MSECYIFSKSFVQHNLSLLKSNARKIHLQGKHHFKGLQVVWVTIWLPIYTEKSGENLNTTIEKGVCDRPVLPDPLSAVVLPDWAALAHPSFPSELDNKG